MEGGSPGETRRAPRPPKQRGRAQAPAESPEAARGPHAVLEGKVKALKEKRGAGRPAGAAPAAPERPSPKKPRPRRAKPGADGAPEPRAQVRTYLTDGPLDGGGAAGAATAPGTACRGRAGGPWRMPAPAGADAGLSLAQRVERNRRLLQEVLGLAPGRAAAVPAHEPPASDADWDSGVSLPDAESCRAFGAGPELGLSPRHEQAKQLLQRARMKARTNPLRASHDILPAGSPGRREPGGTPAPEPKRRDGDAPASGSLSDSSSGESSCGQRRRARGPSPSRVRFEDESARDAEVRYLERLQLRQRRALDSALCSLGRRGSPLPQPDPAGRGSGGERPSRGPAAPGGPGAAASAGGKCEACGSFLGASVAGRSGDPRAGSSAAAQENSPGERQEAKAPPPEPKTRTLGPRGSPLWILPSRQRIHTEKIKETYIGDVTYIDDVDSALESTDTSDSCRTDSEEAGPRGARPAGHRHPRARQRDAPGKEPRGAKPEREQGGGRRDSGSNGDAAADGPAALSPLAAPPGKTSGREEGEGGAGPGRAPRSSPPGAGASAPPAAGKACCPAPCGRAAAAGGPEAPSREAGRPEPCSPRRLRASSTNNCNNTRGRGPPDGAGQSGAERVSAPAAACPAPEREETPRTRGKRDPRGSAAGGAPAEPAAGRSGGGSPSAAGLRRLLGSLSQSTKQRLGRFRCYSMEQLPAAPAPPAAAPLPGLRTSPSLQSLRLVSPFCQLRKASSVQNLHAVPGKAPRAGAYVVAEPGDRKRGPAPRRSLSAEDIGAPDLLRTVGRVVEVFPDGTSQLELQRPPDGAFGFRLASGHGRPDTGVYVQEMADAGTAKLYAGLLGVGDEILQVNGAAVSGLGLAHIRELLLRADTLSLRVLRQRPARR
ncbi:uncharacterized protein KIAA1614 homolog [Struthio camelus]|uniref:uncharacterized protein KIAA1614 homolog n=1 Tax=Struthio camelus TaxID=8801 RepID=UPI003603F5EB